MDSEQLKDILTKHRAWVNDENGGVCADLSGADLSEADLRRANLRRANLSRANLSGADLSDADLSEADLIRANLRRAVLSAADLSEADLSAAVLSAADLSAAVLSGADLSGAVLSAADLSEADLIRANLSWADLSGADLRRAVLSDADLKNVRLNAVSAGFFLACPEVGSFTAFKKASNYIVVLEIPADARRSSATTLKCRCDKAKVLRIENLDGSISDLTFVPSNYDNNFIYTVGETVCVDDFDTDRWNECSRGIHFFLSRELAVQY